MQAGGDVVAYMSKGKDVAPIDVEGSYHYVSGDVYVLVSGKDADSPEGRWKVVSGDVLGVEEMAKSTSLVFGSSLRKGGFVSETFEGLGKDNALEMPSKQFTQRLIKNQTNVLFWRWRQRFLRISRLCLSVLK